MDLDGNGVCMDCYVILKNNNNAKKFRMEWLDCGRPHDLDIYE